MNDTDACTVHVYSTHTYSTYIHFPAHYAYNLKKFKKLTCHIESSLISILYIYISVCK